MAQTFIYLFFYIYVGIWLYKKNLVLKKTDFKKLYKTLVTLSRPWSKRNIYICIERKREVGEEKIRNLQSRHLQRHFWSHNVDNKPCLKLGTGRVEISKRHVNAEHDNLRVWSTDICYNTDID